MDSTTTTTTTYTEDTETINSPMFWMIVLFLLFWVIAGLVAFFMSIVCFAFSGSMGEKIIGFLIAILFGPFYWIYYAFLKTYCRSGVTPSGGAGRRRKI